MRILALETDVEELKKKFLVEGEKAVCVTHRHFVAFFVHILWQTLVSVLALFLILFLAVQGWWELMVYSSFLFTWFFSYAYFLLAAYIQWKCNFLIVTTQKIVIIEQKSLFYQHINPLHFNRISNTRVESQFGGLFRCGILYLNMTVPERYGEFQELVIPFLPNPADIAAVIENGLVMNKKPIEEQEEQKKKEVMREPAVSSENPEPEKLLEQQQKEHVQQKSTGVGPEIGLAIAGEAPMPEKDE